MKVKIIFLASVLMLVGCQASRQDVSAGHVTGQPSANAVGIKNETGSRIDVGNRVDGFNDYPHQKNLWQHIGSELGGIGLPDNRRVQEQKRQYLNKKAFLYSVALRSEPYMHWIVEQIRQRDLPMELALLPIMESEFNPQATSSAKAAGLWQIIPQTGRSYGLTQNHWYDARRDVAASTAAALDILKRLNKMFDGDWLMTLAAYNAGEGRVMQAIKRNKANGRPTDYWSLSLPRETMIYVPKMLALSDVIKNSKQHGLELPKTNSEQALARVEIGQQADLGLIADMAGMSLKKLKSFNSGYIRNVTAPNGPHYVMLPQRYASQFKNSLAETGVNTVAITNNPQTFALAKPSNKTQLSNKTQAYKVRAGDTVTSIAKRLNVTIHELNKWNNLTANSILKAGQKLHVAVNNNRQGKTLANTNKAITYRVRRGDSLQSIAKEHGVKLNDLLDWNKNNFLVNNLIHPGDTLTLLVNKSS